MDIQDQELLSEHNSLIKTDQGQNPEKTDSMRCLDKLKAALISMVREIEKLQVR